MNFTPGDIERMNAITDEIVRLFHRYTALGMTFTEAWSQATLDVGLPLCVVCHDVVRQALPHDSCARLMRASAGPGDAT